MHNSALLPPISKWDQTYPRLLPPLYINICIFLKKVHFWFNWIEQTKGDVAPKTALPYGRDSCICNGIPAIRHARCQKLFLFSQSVAKQKKKAELFCKERLWKDISRSDGKDSTRSTRKKGACLSMGLEKEKTRSKNLLKHWKEGKIWNGSPESMGHSCGWTRVSRLVFCLRQKA